MTQRIGTVLLAWILVLTPGLVHAQDDATKPKTAPVNEAPVKQPKDLLSAIPGNVWAMAYIPNIARLDTRITTLLQQLNLNMFGSPVMMARMMLGLQAGLDDQGGFAVCVLPFENPSIAGQSAVLFVPVSDYGGLIANMMPEADGGLVSKVMFGGQPGYIAQLGSFAVVAQSRETLVSVLTDKSELRNTVGAYLTKRMSDDDLTLWVNVKGFSSSSLFDGLEGMAQAMGFSYEMDVIRKFESGSISLRFDPDGINFGVYVSGQPSTDVARALSATPGTTESLLLGLPNERFIIAMGQIASEVHGQEGASMIDKALGNISNMLASQEDAKPIAKILESIRQPIAEVAKSVAHVAVSVGPLPKGSNGMIAVTKVVTTRGSARELLDLVKTIITNMKTGFADVPEAAEAMQMIKYIPTAESIDGISVDHLVITLPAEAKEEIGPKGLANIMAVLGEEDLRVRLAAVNQNHAAVTIGGGSQRMKQIIASVKSNKAPLAECETLKSVVDRLPRKRNTEFYLAVNPLFEMIKAFAEMAGEPINVDLAEVKTPIAAVSGPVGNNGNQSDIHIPLELMVAIKDAVTQAMGQQQMAPAPKPAS